MTQLQKFSKSWKLSLLIPALLLNSCSSKTTVKPQEPEVIVQTKIVKNHIPIQARPKGLQMKDIEWYVVNEENFQTFVEKLKKEQGKEWVFFAMTPKSYENLSLNVADIRRYIVQQLDLITYYETSITDNITTQRE